MGMYNLPNVAAFSNNCWLVMLAIPVAALLSILSVSRGLICVRGAFLTGFVDLEAAGFNEDRLGFSLGGLAGVPDADGFICSISFNRFCTASPSM